MKKISILISGILIFLIDFVWAHAEGGDSDYHGMMSGFYGMSGMWFFGGIFMILIIVALILLIIWLIREINEKPKGGHRKK